MHPKGAVCFLQPGDGVGKLRSVLADAAAEGRPYIIDCPSLLICGEKDAAGSARDYNKRWAAAENLDLHWIAAAGHNSNTDKPDEVNTLIEEFWNRMR